MGVIKTPTTVNRYCLNGIFAFQVLDKDGFMLAKGITHWAEANEISEALNKQVLTPAQTRGGSDV